MRMRTGIEPGKEEEDEDRAEGGGGGARRETDLRQRYTADVLFRNSPCIC